MRNDIKTKKAFTITELIIVIVVLSILASVLIPTFSYIIQKAKDSAKLQNDRNNELESIIDSEHIFQETQTAPIDPVIIITVCTSLSSEKQEYSAADLPSSQDFLSLTDNSATDTYEDIKRKIGKSPILTDVKDPNFKGITSVMLTDIPDFENKAWDIYYTSDGEVFMFNKDESFFGPPLNVIRLVKEESSYIYRPGSPPGSNEETRAYMWGKLTDVDPISEDEINPITYYRDALNGEMEEITITIH